MSKPTVRKTLDTNTNSTEAVTSLMSLGQMPALDPSTLGNGLFSYQPTSNVTFEPSTAVVSAVLADTDSAHSRNLGSSANYTTATTSNSVGQSSLSFLQESPTSVSSNSSNFAVDSTKNLNTYSVNRQDEPFSLPQTINLQSNQQHHEQGQLQSHEQQSLYHNFHSIPNESKTQDQLSSQIPQTQVSGQNHNFYNQPFVTQTSADYFLNPNSHFQLGSVSHRLFNVHKAPNQILSPVNFMGYSDDGRFNHTTPVSGYDSLYQNIAVSQPQSRMSNNQYFNQGFENQALQSSQSNVQRPQQPVNLETPGPYLQVVNSDNSSVYVPYSFHQTQTQQASGDSMLDQSKIAVPLNSSSWKVNQNSQIIPYKTLTFTSGDTIENAIYTKLWCRNGSNEFSPIFKSDNKYNSMSLNQPKGKITKIENLIKTGATNRLFHKYGIHSMNNEVSLAGKDILKLCVDALYTAVGTPEEFQSYRSHNEIINSASREPNRGIASQRALPPGVDMIMTAQHKAEIKNTFLRWSSQRPKTENFFRMEDKKGLSFSLEELKEVLDILMSRPPRRINNYAARQVLTDVAYGQGRGVTEFNQNVAPLHVQSEVTRKVSRLSPAGICPVMGADGQMDTSEPIPYNSMSPKDVPYLNTKKSNQYDPCYCRRQGIHKEGWCGICKNGGWFLMKNSGYLYHQNHEHGIFPGGYIFEDPLVIRRKVSREARWEGLCGICYHWIDLDHTERKLWGTWYRHYKLCVNEYEEIKKLLRATCAPVELIEIEYIPPSLM